MADSWLSIAIRRDGPDQKQGYGHIPARTLAEIAGVCVHSMEGSLAAAMGELDNPNRQASWTFSNPKSGKLLQHYPLQSVTWGNGSPEANRLFVSVEHEGIAGEPLTDSQVANDVELIPLICKTPYQRGTNLVEHNEMVAYGAKPTACPSGRIPWAEILAKLEGDDMPLSDADKDWINHAIKQQLENERGATRQIIDEATADNKDDIAAEVVKAIQAAGLKLS